MINQDAAKVTVAELSANDYVKLFAIKAAALVSITGCSLYMVKGLIEKIIEKE